MVVASDSCGSSVRGLIGSRTKSRRTTIRRPCARHPWRTAFGVLLLALVVLVLLWDWNWFKGPIERRVEAQTGRSFDIGGDLDVDHLGWTPTIRADGLRFGNAAWSKEPTMAQADRLEFSIELKPLLFERSVRIPDIRLDEAVPAPGTRPAGRRQLGVRRVRWHGAAVPQGLDRRRAPAVPRRGEQDRHRCGGVHAKARKGQGPTPRRRSSPRAAVAGRATASRCRAARNPRWSCATRTGPTGSTRAQAPDATTRACTRHSARSAAACAISTCNWPCPGPTWKTCIR